MLNSAQGPVRALSQLSIRLDGVQHSAFSTQHSAFLPPTSFSKSAPIPSNVCPMALAFRDFSPHLLAAPRRGVVGQWEPLTGVVGRANQWLDSAGLKALNVETLLLPVGKNASPNPASGSNVERWDEDHQWLQVVRVWYEAPPSPGLVPPAVAPASHSLTSGLFL